MKRQKSTEKLPEYFAPLLWSYDFSAIHPEKNKVTIIIQTINYGDLAHIRWIIRQYGKNEIKKVLAEIPHTALRPRARRLAATLFNIPSFNHAPRSS